MGEAPDPPVARPQGRPLLAGVVILLSAVAIAYVLGLRSATRSGSAASPAVEQVPPALEQAPGDRTTAPSFDLPSLRGPERIRLADFRGQVVVLNFFASWCRPCELEAADLERTWRAYAGRGVVFVGIAVQDQYHEALAFLRKHGITYPAAFDGRNEVMQAYRITGIPTTVFVDAAGRHAGRHIGIFVGDEGVARLRARIETVRGMTR